MKECHVAELFDFGDELGVTVTSLLEKKLQEFCELHGCTPEDVWPIIRENYFDRMDLFLEKMESTRGSIRRISSEA